MEVTWYVQVTQQIFLKLRRASTPSPVMVHLHKTTTKKNKRIVISEINLFYVKAFDIL